MNFLIKKISIIAIIIISILSIINYTKQVDCLLCNDSGKLPCSVCDQGVLNQEVCQFCDGYGNSVCTLCNKAVNLEP